MSSAAMIPPQSKAGDAPTFSPDFTASIVPESKLLALSLGNPFRPVDWRWRLSVFLSERRPAPRRLDEWVKRALRFNRKQGRCKRPRRSRLAPGESIIDQAHRLYTGHDAFQRCEIEARLLAGESFEEIAGKCNSTPNVIEAFHELFFDVRHRLHAEGYITTMAISPKAAGQLTEDDVGAFLKLFGYAYGQAGVDTLLGYYRNAPLQRLKIEGMNLDELKELSLMLQIRAVILALIAPVNASTLPKMLLLSAEWERHSVAGEGLPVLSGFLSPPVAYQSMSGPSEAGGSSPETSPRSLRVIEPSTPATLANATPLEAPSVLSDLLHRVRLQRDPEASPLARCG